MIVSASQRAVCLILYCSDDRALLKQYRSWQQLLHGRGGVLLHYKVLVSVRLSRRTHINSLFGLTVLCNPTFHLPALRDRLRLHRSLHVPFDVPKQKTHTKSKLSIKSERRRWRLAQSDFTGHSGVHVPLNNLNNKCMCMVCYSLNSTKQWIQSCATVFFFFCY